MKIGSIVICIAGFSGFDPLGLPVTKPAKEIMYTVRGTSSDELGDCIVLEEIINPVRDYGGVVTECHFGIEGFRELLPPEEAEAILTEALKEPDYVER